MPKKFPTKTKQITVTVPDMPEVWAIHKPRSGFVHLLGIVILLAGAFLGGMYYEYKQFVFNDNIERQRHGDLTQTEKDLQAARRDINQLKSEIKTKDELLEAAKKDKDFQYQQSKEKLETYDLAIDSLQKIITRLQGSSDKGKGVLTTVNGVSSYYWSDEYNRFRLTVPDITQSYAHFDYDQRFKINIIAFKQKPKDGAIRVSTVHMYEITANGQVIKEAYVDLDQSTFQYAIDQQREQSARNWLVNLSNKGELLVSWLPISKYDGMFGAGLSAGMNANNSKFVGVTVMGFPPKWYKSGFGIGASVGYDPNDKHVAYRLQLAWSFTDIFRSKK